MITKVKLKPITEFWKPAKGKINESGNPKLIAAQQDVSDEIKSCLTKLVNEFRSDLTREQFISAIDDAKDWCKGWIEEQPDHKWREKSI